MKLKICGMKDQNNIVDVANTSPDYMGFIFYPSSPRYVHSNFTMPAIPERIKKVGIFVNENSELVEKIIDQYTLHFVQLHGEESVADCRKLKHVTGVIKAFSISDGFDFDQTKQYADDVDFFLFDAKGKSYGGNGKTFDWRKLEEFDQSKPFFLSGGLTCNNIDQLHILKGMNVHAIDVNSGVEIAPGLKDLQKIKILNAKLKSHELQR